MKPDRPAADGTDAGTELGDQDAVQPDALDAAPPKVRAADARGAGRSRVGQAFRKAMGWLFGVLAVFFLGALIAAIFLYLPARQKLLAASTSLEEAQQRIEAQDEQISLLQSQGQSRDQELSLFYLLEAVTTVELEVMEASLAVVENNYSRASLAIDRAESALEKLALQVDESQSPIMADLEKKLSQARSKAQGNLRTALPELRTLSGDLDKLKDTIVPER